MANINLLISLILTDDQEDDTQRGKEHFDKQSLYNRSPTTEGGSTIQSSRSDSLDDSCSLLVSSITSDLQEDVR